MLMEQITTTQDISRDLATHQITLHR